MLKRPSFRPFPLDRVYELIEPGPVVLLVTARGGNPNIMAMSWHMMLEFEPPLVACICSSANYSFEALRKTGECVIAIPARKLAPKVVKVGNTSGRDLDKFAAFGLSTTPATQVAVPLVQECFANLECRLFDKHMVERYNMSILEVVAAWVDPRQKTPKTIHHRGYGTFAVDGPLIKLSSRKP